MKLPLTRYGLRELLLYPIIFILIGILFYFLLPGWRPWPQIAAVLLALCVIAFFRDPQREIPDEEGILVSPADGKVTDICEMKESEYIQGRAMRIGIFLSVFDVHINRAPCPGIVEYIKEKPGKCLNAMRSQAASEQNQSNTLGLACPGHPAGKVMVKQITGAIARRIVCACQIGNKLLAGQRFGMIKFGSRTELFFPVNSNVHIVVQKGDIVRAGKTILVRYDNK
jgi:phosphatidylserine decarboxylase